MTESEFHRSAFFLTLLALTNARNEKLNVVATANGVANILWAWRESGMVRADNYLFAQGAGADWLDYLENCYQQLHE